MAGAGAAAAQAMRRVPSIKFRYFKSSGAAPQAQSGLVNKDPTQSLTSDVPALPRNTDFGGKASLQPKRSPVSAQEIEAIMLGGIF